MRVWGSNTTSGNKSQDIKPQSKQQISETYKNHTQISTSTIQVCTQTGKWYVAVSYVEVEENRAAVIQISH